MKITGAFLSLLLPLAAAQDFGNLVEVPVGTKTYTTGIRYRSSGGSFCGGSLITPKHVLTAAHCYGSIEYVSVGTHYVQGAQDGQQVRVVKKTKHPNRKTWSLSQKWDFMVLELEEPVVNIEPVALAKADGSDTIEGDIASVMGWGNSHDDLGEKVSKVLLSVNVTLLSNEECSKNVKGIHESMLCAGGNINEDVCAGDVGGPLVVDKNGRDVLVGVVSWNQGCDRADKPGVYARVSKARDWLNKVAPGVQWR